MSGQTELTLTLRFPGILSEREREVAKEVVKGAVLDFTDTRNVMVLKLPHERDPDGPADAPGLPPLSRGERVALVNIAMQLIAGFYNTKHVLVTAMPKDWSDDFCMDFMNRVNRLLQEANA